MSEIKFDVPGPDAPGFLRRQRKVLEFQQSLSGTPTPDMLDALVDFLADFITDPPKREDAVNALWDATQEQFELLLKTLGGQDEENPTE